MKKMQKLAALLLAGCMVLGLGVTALADGPVYICGKEAHTHGVDCANHAHGDDCYSVTCGEEEITCLAPVHDHSADCSCGSEEEGHTHSAECCVIPVHAHSDACSHAHSAACKTLTCTLDESAACTAEEHTHSAACIAIASIGSGESTKYYANIFDAVTDANKDTTTEGAVTIVLIADSEFNKSSTIKRDITINGQDYTLLRADDYTGNLFIVNANNTLVVEDVVIDGNNNWLFDEEAFNADLESGQRIADTSSNVGEYITLEEGAPVANKTLIDVRGGSALVLDGVTIQNNAAKNSTNDSIGHGTLIYVAKGAEVTLTDTVIDHNTKTNSTVVSYIAAGGKLTVEDGTVIKNNHGQNGNAAVFYMTGEVVMNGGEIHGNTGVDCNGSVAMIYKDQAKFTMNGGKVYDNSALRGTSNGWNCVFYVYGNGGEFEMNGGEIFGNTGTWAPGIVSNGDKATVSLNGGTIKDNISTAGRVGPDVYVLCDAILTKDMEITGSRFYNDFTNTSTLTGDVWFDGTYKGEEGDVGPFDENTYTGSGTVIGDVTIFNGSDTEMLNGEWLDGMVTVDSIEKAASLTVKGGATIDGVQVRVLDSVASGDSENSSEAKAAQDASYVQENGADVKSPVQYYHRLTSGQKSDIVITYDYNGGLDAQNWSGIQRTGEGQEYDLSNMPAPTKPGYKLAGWTYAEVDDPESLSMDGTEDYKDGDIATRSLRLIAVWEPVEDEPYIPVVPFEPFDPNPNTDPNPNPTDGEKIEDNDTPLTDGEIIEDEDVPLAGVPNTGSKGSVAFFAGMAALLAAAAVIVIRRKQA